jgi:hypothetical protein
MPSSAVRRADTIPQSVSCRYEATDERGLPRSNVHVFVKYWEIIAGNLKKRGWSYGYVSAVDSQGRTIWIVDAHRGDGKRFVVYADEKLTAFLELESAIEGRGELSRQVDRILSKLDVVKRIRIRRRTFPPLGSSPLPDPATTQNQFSGEKGRKGYESN